MAYFRLRTPYFQFIPQNLQYVYRSVCRNRCIYSQGQRSVNLLFGAQKIVHYWIKIFSAKRNMINVLLYNIGSFSKKRALFWKKGGYTLLPLAPTKKGRGSGRSPSLPRSAIPGYYANFGRGNYSSDTLVKTWANLYQKRNQKDGRASTL